MSVFKEGEKLFEGTFGITAVPVSYVRNGTVLAKNVPAKLGKTLFRTDDLAGGVTIRLEQRDFIVRTSDVAAIGEPKKGDEIVYDGHTYMVSAPDGEPCWKWHTRHSHTQLRIHTKEAGEKEDSDE